MSWLFYIFWHGYLIGRLVGWSLCWLVSVCWLVFVSPGVSLLVGLCVGWCQSVVSVCWLVFVLAGVSLLVGLCVGWCQSVGLLAADLHCRPLTLNTARR